MCGPRWATELHDLIPGSRKLILERSGHFGHLEEPDVFADGVIDFVESLSDRRRPVDLDR
jgi:pimeloyl-ACP methyl ester carboxylesterase